MRHSADALTTLLSDIARRERHGSRRPRQSVEARFAAERTADQTLMQYVSLILVPSRP